MTLMYYYVDYPVFKKSLKTSGMEGWELLSELILIFSCLLLPLWFNTLIQLLKPKIKYKLWFLYNLKNRKISYFYAPP